MSDGRPWNRPASVFEVIQNLHMFGWVIIAGLLLFLPPELVDSMRNLVP